MPAASPFPGMDPYLERHWLDVHAVLAGNARRVLNERLPDDLVASIEEYAAIGERQREQRVAPDVHVREAEQSDAGGGGTATLAAPAAALATAPAVLLELRDEPITLRRLKVEEIESGRLVTVIEFISPTNKRGDGLRQYRRKRRGLLERGVNVVEVDLHRRGNWRAFLRPFECAPRHVTPYRVTTQLPGDVNRLVLLPIRLQERLPEIVVPLRPHDPRITLDLQPLLDDVYTSGRYDRRLDYAKPPEPPFGDPGDVAFIAEITAAHRAT